MPSMSEMRREGWKKEITRLWKGDFKAPQESKANSTSFRLTPPKDDPSDLSTCIAQFFMSLLEE